MLNAIVLGAGSAPQATVIAAGAVIVGKVAGDIVIVLDTEDKALPQLSVAVHVSVTVPPHAFGVALKVEALEIPLIKHPPVKPLLNAIVLGAGSAPQATVMSAGAVIVGKAAGLTVIVLDTEDKALPQLSVLLERQHALVANPRSQQIARHHRVTDLSDVCTGIGKAQRAAVGVEQQRNPLGVIVGDHGLKTQF